MEEKNSLAVASLVVLVLFLLLVGGIYYWMSNRSKGAVIFPNGINYLGPSTTLTPEPTIDLSKLGQSGQWIKVSGRHFKFDIAYPAELQVTAFIDDPTDKLAWITGIKPPQENVFASVEKMSELGLEYTGQPEKFAYDFWKKFSGLSGVQSVTAITNQKNLKGFKAIYTTKTPGVTVTNYFFPVPNDDDHVLQVLNGILPVNIFNSIVNSVEFTK